MILFLGAGDGARLARSEVCDSDPDDGDAAEDDSRFDFEKGDGALRGLIKREVD